MFDLKEAEQSIAKAMIADQFSLRKTLQSIKNKKKLNKVGEAENNIETIFHKKLFNSIAQRESRTQPYKITYPEALPVSQKVHEIKQLLTQNQLIIVAGETGSGKSTQLPKICLELGFAQGGMIGHTQPRRIAAKTLASRIEEELLADIPDASKENLVACKVRFSDSVKDTTKIKLMTDGMLLAEIQQDLYLEKYQCLIIDEAHERSLNIDFLLGFIKRLLTKRKDLKVIITSATIDVNKISTHFNDAPILEVSGRNFPVAIHYLENFSDASLLDGQQKNDENNQQQSLTDLIESILLNQFSKNTFSLAQDILIFLATENEIRQYSKTLRQYFQNRLDIFPLYGRLPLNQQKEIFSPKSKKRRVILASNVAETSVTVPNIGFVIDFGLARISRYSARTKVQQLPIEKISQASANQRSGRCGRIAPGVCFRLYSQEDFETRSAFTEPEIQRSHLSAVILKMESLRLGRIENFPLLDMPDNRLVKDAYKLLFELEAIDHQEKLTAIGKKMANLQIDPRFARMLIEAEKLSCVEEVLIIVCGLSINDPRQRPQELQKQADAKHALFQHPKSDFLSYYKLWHVLENKRRELSNAQFRRYCEQHFIAWNTVREWRDMHRQLLLQLRSPLFVENKVAPKKLKVFEKEFDETSLDELFTHGKQFDLLYAQIHKALLKGLLSHIARLGEAFVYEGVNKKQIYIFPSSSLMKQKVSWIMCAQLLETSKLFAHCCAEIQSQWVFEQGKHLLSLKIFDAFWSKKQGSVQAYQQASLGGLIIEHKKPVKVHANMGRELTIDLPTIFIQGALIEKQYHNPPKVLLDNWQALTSIHELEQKLRRADLLPDDYALQDFYRQRIPKEILDTRSFEFWLKQQGNEIIRYNEDFLTKREVYDNIYELFPDRLPSTPLDIPCDYIFDPLTEEDGLSIRIRFDQLNQLNQQTIEWLVPGLIQEKCECLVKTLPKALRKLCLPVKETVGICLQRMNFSDGDLLEVFAKELTRATGEIFNKTDFIIEKLPKHLRCTILVIDEQNRVIEKAYEVDSLRNLLQERMKALITVPLIVDKKNHDEYSDSIINSTKEIKRWDFGNIEKEVFFDKKSANSQESYRIKLYSALQDNGDYVALVYQEDPDISAFIHARGQRRLMSFQLASLKRDLKKEFRKVDQAVIKLFSAGDSAQVFDDLFSALIDQVFFIESSQTSLKSLPALVYKQSDFEQRFNQGKNKLFTAAQTLFEVLVKISDKVFDLRKKLDQNASALKLKHLKWIEAHMLDLIRPGFMSETPLLMLYRYPLYLDALQVRIDRLQGNIDRDEHFQKILSNFNKRFKPCRDNYVNSELHLFLKRERLALVLEFSCLLEEFAMSYFVQNKKPLMPVSEKLLAIRLTELGV